MAAGASVDPAASVHESAVLEAGVVVHAGVHVAAGAVIKAGTVLEPGARILENAVVGPYAVIAGVPADHAFKGEASLAVIEAGAMVREFVTVHRATGEGQTTRVGAGAMVMAYSHVGHNAQVGNRAVLTNLVQLGGHVQVGDDAVVGGGTVVHQFSRIGRLAMLGGGSALGRDVLPFAMARGNPARHLRLNAVGLKRAGFTKEDVRTLGDALAALRAGDHGRFEQLAVGHPLAAEIKAFQEASTRGVERFMRRSR